LQLLTVTKYLPLSTSEGSFVLVVHAGNSSTIRRKNAIPQTVLCGLIATSFLILRKCFFQNFILV
jgi:hypothetical protein